MKKRSIAAVFFTMVLGMTTCVGLADDEMFTDRDRKSEYNEAKSAYIQLNGDSAVCDSDAVSISGSTVTILDEGTYIFSGSLENGMIIVNADEKDKPQIVLDGVSIHSESSAALYILEGDKVIVTLAEGTENTLSSGESFIAIDENEIDAAVFSKQDLTFNGSGSLTVTSPAGHGIVSKDDLVLTGGTYKVTSASHGLDANDSIRIDGAELEIISGKDGLHAENNDDAELGFVYIENGTFIIEAEGDGISAGAYMQIENGSFDIVSGGGSENAEQQTSDYWGGFGGRMGGGMKGGGTRGGMDSSNNQTQSEDESTDGSTSIKGIKANGNLVINNGTFLLDTADDAIHSNASVTINGGSFEIASGDDAVHAEETLTVSDGTIKVTESYEGLEGLHIEISGGVMELVSSDDGLNAAGGTDQSGFGGMRGNDMFGGTSNGSIVISGGSIFMNASGDGIDSNGTLEISGGEIKIYGPTSGDTAVLDYDTTAVITGGTFVGTGSYMMAQTFSSSEQGVIALSVGNQAAGTKVTLTDKEGNVLIEAEPNLSYAITILSCPEMVSGETYTVTVGTASGDFTAN